MKIKEYFSGLLVCFTAVILFCFIFSARENLLVNAANLKMRIQAAVFLQRGLASPEIVAEKIRALENFGALEFIPKEKTRVSMSEFKNDVAISGENPFPDAFRVTPAKTGAADVENLASEIRRIKGVEEVRYDRGLVALTQTLDEAGSFAGYVIKIIAVALMALLIMAALPVFKTGRVFAGQAFRDSSPAAAGRFDFFRLLWTGGGGLAALAAFETLRRLAAADVTSGIRTADAILALAGGMVFSAASAMLFPAKEEHGENE